MRKKFTIAISAILIILSLIFFWLKNNYPDFNFIVLMSGNVIMAVLSFVSFYLVTTQIKKKPDAFVRGVYSSSFLKLFVCIISILTYAILNKDSVHKPSLFILFGIYAAYSIAETWMLSKMAREIK